MQKQIVVRGNEGCDRANVPNSRGPRQAGWCPAGSRVDRMEVEVTQLEFPGRLSFTSHHHTPHSLRTKEDGMTFGFSISWKVERNLYKLSVFCLHIPLPDTIHRLPTFLGTHCSFHPELLDAKRAYLSPFNFPSPPHHSRGFSWPGFGFPEESGKTEQCFSYQTLASSSLSALKSVEESSSFMWLGQVPLKRTQAHEGETYRHVLGQSHVKYKHKTY